MKKQVGLISNVIIVKQFSASRMICKFTSGFNIKNPFVFLARNNCNCIFCKKVFWANNDLRSHIRYKHIRGNMEKCIVCENVFCVLNELRIHTRSAYL